MTVALDLQCDCDPARDWVENAWDHKHLFFKAAKFGGDLLYSNKYESTHIHVYTRTVLAIQKFIYIEF